MTSLRMTLLATSLALGATPITAQQPDLDLMAKWSGADVVHYDVVAEFSGETEILRANGVAYQAPVKDRIEVGFDWNQLEMKLVGTPVIKNFPTTTAQGKALPPCPLPRVTGAYEHATATAASSVAYNPVVNLAATRAFPTGAMPHRDELGCGTTWDEVAAKSEPAGVSVLVLPSLYLAMPAAAGASVTVGKDGKTMTSTISGWTYTYTLSMK
jgi:hypothetical protein